MTPSLPLLIAILGFPLVAPLVVSAVLWRKLRWRWLFLVVSIFCLAFIGETSFDVLQAYMVPDSPYVFTPNSVEVLQGVAHARMMVMLLADVVVLIVGLPLLYWLFTALRKAPSSSVSS